MWSVKYSTYNYDTKLRLNIRSISGYKSELTFRFNYSKDELAGREDALGATRAIMSTYWRMKGDKMEPKHEFGFVMGSEGFTLTIEGNIRMDEESALSLIKDMLDHVIGFDLKVLDQTDEGVKALVGRAKQMASELEKEIFEEHSYSFHHEYWDPFD